LVTFNGQRLRSTLGGTGLAISADCTNRDAALAYAQFVAGAECQRGMYVSSGGQPGYRAAWVDPEVNASCGNFFQQTLPTLDEAYQRPRYNGYIPFQDHAGPIVHAYLRDSGSAQIAIEQINQWYRESRK
jgi:multiple sugar transport system substrate-binding protein